MLIAPSKDMLGTQTAQKMALFFLFFAVFDRF